jgi:SulP family sulfate permease
VIAPEWARGYRREWLRPDLVAGVVIWSVVTPQALAYAQIAGLPPEAGLMAAPVAMLGYGLIGTSRQLVVSATTATSAVSAAAVGPLADGDPVRFAALSAALALVTAAVLVAAGVLRLGAIADLVSKPVMTGFLFGLGLTIMIGQLPSVLGVPAGEGNFFPRLWDLLGDLGEVQGATLAVGAASLAILLAGPRLLPVVPATLLALVLSIVAAAVFDLGEHGVALVGDVPTALPDPAIPDVSADDVVNLIAPALGVLVVSAEAVGVARSLATEHGYRVDANRDLVGLGGANLLAGLSSGFVQSGGASQTAAADGAGGRSQLAALSAAGLILLTGAFLAPLFEDLPQATLGAIVVVAVAGFFRVGELQRFLRIRRSAVVWAGLALAGVLVLGVLQGLVVTAVLSLVYVVQRLSRPSVGPLARDPATGVWGRAERHPDWERPQGVLAVRSDGPLFYANTDAVKQRILSLAASEPRPSAVALDLAETTEVDVQTADTLGELVDALEKDGIELRLVNVRAPALEVLRRARVAERVRIAPTLDEAVRQPPQ